MGIAYRNKYPGICDTTGVSVAKGAGWVVPSTATRHDAWRIICDEVCANEGHRTRDTDGIKRRGGIGVTMRKSVRNTWAALFDRNEQMHAICDHPLTDKQLSEFMLCEFPYSSEKSRTIARVRMHRGCYNKGTHSFDGMGVPDALSHEYDDDGKPLSGKRCSTSSRTTHAGLSEDQVRGMIAEAVDAAQPTIININYTPRKKISVDATGKHTQFEVVLRKVAAGIPILLVGPTGSGKTYLAGQLAEALNLDFTFNSMSEGVSESVVLGRQLPNAKGDWKYQPSPFVQTFERGGLHLFDEIDAADANLLITVNTALANGLLSIPARGTTPIKQHKNTVIVCAANTFGNGADRQYVGRNQLDAATLNRFTMGTVFIDYDPDVEKTIVGAILGGDGMGDALLTWAWHVRSRIGVNHLRRVMSTRNIEDGAKLLAAGEQLTSIKSTYFNGWGEDERRKVTS